jgi:aspartate-semialdehyde dehydrogenase
MNALKKINHKKYNLADLQIAVVGATGAVGGAILTILNERNVPSANIKAIASNRSQNRSVGYGEDQSLTVYAIENFDFSTVHIAFFAAGSEVSKVYVPKASKQGALVIDKASCFRLQNDVPLVVPEVNPQTLNLAESRRVVANPNCSTIQLVSALKPIHDINPIKRVVVSTYQAVSGAGRQAMDVLYNQTKTVLINQPCTDTNIFTKPIAFNVIPQIDAFTPNGDTKEELKMILETQKILDNSAITISVTCVRVPVFVGHSMAVNIELANPVELNAIQKALKASKAIHLTTKIGAYQSPIEVVQEDPVYVSRLRIDPSLPHGISMWIVADNMRKGAALNGVQIAQEICENYPHLISEINSSRRN